MINDCSTVASNIPPSREANAQVVARKKDEGGCKKIFIEEGA
jgi:hypothetical protein